MVSLVAALLIGLRANEKGRSAERPFREMGYTIKP
jgi:hypothetical protein